MYRKGLSSRANKVSSLVASTDNSGPGSIGQDAVPTAGAHGIRKNVFRRMPSLIPKKSVSRFSKMAIPTRPYPFLSKQHLQEAIVEYFITAHDKAWRAYGDIGSWNTTAITDMSSLFTNIANGGLHDGLISLTKNELSAISNWNVSNVTNMSNMFNSSQFNGDLSNWNVSKVTDFSRMFRTSLFANDTILKWDVRSGTNFSNMFAAASNFTTNLRYWNITSGAVLTNMFDGTGNANGNIETLGYSPPTATPNIAFFNKITIIFNGTAGLVHERTQPYYDAGATTLTGEIPFISSNDLDVDVVNNTAVDGPYEIIYTAENSSRFASGVEASTETRRINVVDTTLPIITLTGPSIVTLERGDTYTDHGATATEGTVTNNIATAINDGTKNFTVGTYYIRYEATDTTGNAGTKDRAINVVDTTPPVFTVNSFNDPHTVYMHPTNMYGPPGTDDVTADDLGTNINLVTNDGAVDITKVGTQTYTVSATDAYNNTATMSRTVNVVSIILTITGLSSVETSPLPHIINNPWVEPAAGSGFEIIATAAVNILGAANEGDDVSAQITSDVSALDVTTLGNYTVTYSINDGNGNIYTATRYVQVTTAL